MTARSTAEETFGLERCKELRALTADPGVLDRVARHVNNFVSLRGPPQQRGSGRLTSKVAARDLTKIADEAAPQQRGSGRFTSKVAVRDLTKIADEAAMLIRSLSTSEAVSVMGLQAALATNGGAIRDGWFNAETLGDPPAVVALIEELRVLRGVALAALSTVDGNHRVQIRMSEPGRPRSAAAPLVHLVMYELFMSGEHLIASADSVALQLVDAALGAAGCVGVSADNQVKEWLARHPMAPRGGRSVLP